MPQIVPLIGAAGTFNELGLGKLGQSVRVVEQLKRLPSAIGLGTLTQVLNNRSRAAAARTAYLYIGQVGVDVAFVDGHSVTHKAELAEHALIERKPRLQWTGPALTQHSLTFRLHEQLGNVQAALDALQAICAAHTPQPLVLASGKFVGYFVLTDLEQALLEQRGVTLTHATGSLTLREYAPTAEELQRLGQPVKPPAVRRAPDQSIAGLTQIEQILRDPAKAITRGAA